MVNRIYQIIHHIYFLMKLNILWLGFTMIGGVVFGFVPATISLYACTRQHIRSGNDLHVFQQYKHFYLLNFKRSLRFSVVFCGAMLLILGESFVLMYFGENINLGLEITIKATRIFMILGGMMFFPVFVHFDIKGKTTWIQPLLFLLICPLEVITIAGITFLCWLLFVISPLLLVFIGISLPVYGMSSILLRRFDRLAENIQSSTTEYVQGAKYMH